MTYSMQDLKPIGRAIIICGIIWGVVIPSGIFAQRNALSAAADRSEQPATVTSSTPDKMKAGDAVGHGYLEDYSGLGIEMKWIPKGHFEMGSKLTADEVASKLGGKKEWYPGELPAHRVELDGFWMGQTEVTVGQFRRFVERTGYKTDAETGGGAWNLVGGRPGQKKDSSWRNPGFSQGDDHPVVCVSWNDATKFCEWLSQESGGRRYRLPTEAQWEYSARGGNKGIFPWGDDPKDGMGWANVADQTSKRKFNWFPIFDFDDGYVYTAPVGSFQANGFGLKDVIGNAAEWCRDWYDADFYARSTGSNPENTIPGEYRVLRGGAWHPNPGYCRPAYRGWNPPALAYYHFGFRVSRTPNP